ncbi:hypothetical protein PA598K_02663 [Paenibacillus sp. 598K]|uniref:spore germination protein n=1 Tax=Paenibacillus sp. 598K TaxID=1117987 RepID=UPI000FF91D78|nr:spore germination protein [Paenibacillus sp. 598K]GBF74325.1 hypothetical protein PA598K_02663 [Paenibacillus sp. 598K]
MSNRESTVDSKDNDVITGRPDIDEARLQTVFSGCSDIIFHSFQTESGLFAVCIFCVGLCDAERIERQVLMPLAEADAGSPAVSSSQLVFTIEEATQAILDGLALLLVEGQPSGSVFALSKNIGRTTEEPAAESTVRGARDGFTESLESNMALLRMRLKIPAFKSKSLTIGKYTNTKVTLAYVEGVIAPELVEEAERRLGRLELDSVLESHTIEEGIVDERFSPFPQMLATERPDVVVSNLLEGRFVILVDGTPFSLVAPITLSSMLQSPEDYYQNIYISVAIRWMRYVFYILSLLLPSAYVAITTFHQEMVPTVLLLSIARAREEIPFPALIEALIMEVSFEALREAGVRLPKQIGSAVSIVGALIIGQAATSAGIVSAPMIIVVAMTGIASFMIPRYSASISTRLLRFPIMLLAGTLGLIGIMLGIILLVIHLSSIRSFGTPYLYPIAPTSGRRLHDVWSRTLPWSKSR